MAINLIALKAELEEDPKQLGLSDLLMSGDASKIVNVLNSRIGDGAELSTSSEISKGDLVMWLIPILSKLSGTSEAIKNKWDTVLKYLLPSCPDTIRVKDPRIQVLLQAAITDGLTTKEYVNKLNPKKFSRSEVLFGENVFVNIDDISSIISLFK